MTRVTLCCDEPMLAHGLVLILHATEDLKLAGRCADPEMLRDVIGQQRPDLLLVAMTADIHIGTFARLLSETPAPPRTIFWMRTIASEMALQALSIGVRGVLPRTATQEALIECLRRVRDGELWFERPLTDTMQATQRHTLTRREGQIVELLIQGLKNKDLAAAIGVSEGSIKVYLSRLFHKLGVRDRFELALFGIKNLTGGLDPVLGGRTTMPNVPAPVATRSFFLNGVSSS